MSGGWYFGHLKLQVYPLWKKKYTSKLYLFHPLSEQQMENLSVQRWSQI